MGNESLGVWTVSVGNKGSWNRFRVGNRWYDCGALRANGDETPWGKISLVLITGLLAHR
jgi:hypothetical protein